MKKLLLFLAIVICTACQPEKVSPGSKTTPAAVAQLLRDPETYDSTTTKGVVLSKVKTVKDTTFTYSLYLPPNFTVTKLWPVIIFFDPQGNPSIAIEKYKNLATKFGMILAGSNDSKNGKPVALSVGIYDRILSDLIGRFPIQETGIMVSGFSGGSKVALFISTSRAAISGTIACSGSLELDSKPANLEYSLYGMGGNGDFNQSEMYSLGNSMKNMGGRVFISEFQGKHEWPPVESMERAFEWMQVRIDKKSSVEKVQQFVEKRDSQLVKISGKASLILEASILEESILLVNEGPEAERWAKRLEEIKKDAGYIKAITLQENLRIEEKNRQAKYSMAFADMDETWWKNEITRLRELAKGTSPESDLEKRLLGYLGILSFSFTTSAVNSLNEKEAIKFLNIYTFLEPENPEHRFLSAVFQARKGKTEEAFTLLLRAVQLGFKGKDRLEAEASFTTYFRQSRWISLLASAE